MESENVFKGQIDRFKGVTINSNEEAKLDEEELAQKLKNSISKWKEEASFNDSIIIFIIYSLRNLDLRLINSSYYIQFNRIFGPFGLMCPYLSQNGYLFLRKNLGLMYIMQNLLPRL